MMTIRDRLMTVMRWAVVAWVVYCAIQMLRWRHFEEPAMVAGWYWIGSVWGCLMSFLGMTRLRRIDWGARLALFAPVGLLLPVFFREILSADEIDVGPEWMWLCLSLCFDLALLPWNWKLPRIRTSFLLVMFVLAGGAGVGITLKTGEVSPVLLVGSLLLLTAAMLRNDGVSPRPYGLTLRVSLLGAIDVCLLIAVVLKKDAAIDWGLLQLVRMATVAILGWRLTCPPQETTTERIPSTSRWLIWIPLKAAKVVVWIGFAAWTTLLCWLMPRCVAIQAGFGAMRSWHVYSPGNSISPEFTRRNRLLSLIWKAGMSKSEVLDIHQTDLRIPEAAFSMREVTTFEAHGTVSDETLRSLQRFPELESVFVTDAQRVTKSGLDALASLPKLDTLHLMNLDFSIDDFVGFGLQPDLDMRLHIGSVRHDSDGESNHQGGIQAMSGLKGLHLVVESNCDEDLALQLCEITSLRDLDVRSLGDTSAPTMKRLLGLKSLKQTRIHINVLGESYSPSDLVELATRMPPKSDLSLNYTSVPIKAADISALKEIEEGLLKRYAGNVVNAQMQPIQTDVMVSVNCILEGDDHFEQFCEVRSLHRMSAKVRGVTERGLQAIAKHAEWHLWEFQFDFRRSPRPAHLWAELIPQKCDRQVIVSPESILTEEDAAALRRLQPTESGQGFGYFQTLHVVCDAPSIQVLERLKQFSIPAQLVVDLSDQVMSAEELSRIVQELPSKAPSVDLRLPRNVQITERNMKSLAALSHIERLRLEVNLDDSAAAAFAELHGLYGLDIRDSDLGPRGFAEFAKCKNLKQLLLQPTSHTRELLSWIGRERHNLSEVVVERPLMNGEFLELLRTFGADWDKYTDGSQLSLILSGVELTPRVINSLNSSVVCVRYECHDRHYDGNHPVFEFPIRARKAGD